MLSLCPRLELEVHGAGQQEEEMDIECERARTGWSAPELKPRRWIESVSVLVASGFGGTSVLPKLGPFIMELHTPYLPEGSVKLEEILGNVVGQL